MTGSRIVNVAIIGAAGNSGRFMTEELLKAGKHKITAISRNDSKAQLPEGINVKRVDYEDESSLEQALQGQDALIITVSNLAPRDLQGKLIKAAAKANVPWIFPNAWGQDGENEALLKDLAMITRPNKEAIELIESLGKSSWIAVSNGFWYEWSLSIPSAFGFDILKRSVTLLDGGNTPMTVSTWPQVGRTVTKLLSLPISPDGSGTPSLDQLRNTHVYVSSFTLTQNEIFESVLRVTGTQRADWQISDSTAESWHKTGWEQLQTGDHFGITKWLYGRCFFLDGVGDIAKNRTLANGVLNLPKEDLDHYTNIAVKRVQTDGVYTSSK